MERNLRLRLSNVMDVMFEDVPEDVRHKPVDEEQKSIAKEFKKEVYYSSNFQRFYNLSIICLGKSLIFIF